MDVEERIGEVLGQYWGYDALRPLQREAIDAELGGRDSLVVMPTGGGKSLCYQVPPIVTERTDVVVSPLISLMKDQVDGLQANGYPAAALHSNVDRAEQRRIEADVVAGHVRLLFVSPERLASTHLLGLLQQSNVGAFAIDEAHCISHWGHDFRPDYRQLESLRRRFPNASIHAYTATATPRVQEDIVDQLALRDPARLVGRCDRPNLTYRIVPRADRSSQVLDAVRRHAGEAVIVYCITRKDTETIAAALERAGIRAAAYHAGLDGRTRRKVQEAFTTEAIDVVVATVAFGMGIDRSDVRCVVHAAMPKSIEHYQQETGRAGRDGLEAECVLLYSAADGQRWRRLVEQAREEGAEDETDAAVQLELLRHMQNLCCTAKCRHGAIVEYFGQATDGDDCGACDVCLGEVESMDGSVELAQKIISCVARLEQRFGVGMVVDVLRGAETDAIRRGGHARLSTYGLLDTYPAKTLTNLVHQLVDLGVLGRSAGDRPILHLNDASVEVLRGERTVELIEPKLGRVRTAKADVESWEGVDRELFEQLRELRRAIAQERGVPPYVIFSDRSLRAMARDRPTNAAAMGAVPGVGAKKLADLGPAFMEAIEAASAARGLATNLDPPLEAASSAPRRRPASRDTRQVAMDMLAEGAPLAAIVDATNRAPSTVVDDCCAYVERERPASIEAWVPEAIRARVRSVIDEVGGDRLKPIHERLGGNVPYDLIKIVVAHTRAAARGDGDVTVNALESERVG